MLQENALLCTLSFKKINEINNDHYIEANVSVAIYNDKEEIYEKSSYCFYFSA